MIFGGVGGCFGEVLGSLWGVLGGFGELFLCGCVWNRAQECSRRVQGSILGGFGGRFRVDFRGFGGDFGCILVVDSRAYQ